MRVLLSLVILSALSACGRDDGGGTPEGAQHSLYIADAAAMPDCTPENEGWLVYVAATKSMQACSGGTWAAIDTQTRLVSSVACLLNQDVGGGDVHFVSYMKDVWSSGDVHVRALDLSVSGGTFDSAMFYAYGTPGEKDGAISVGKWELASGRTAKAMTATYDKTVSFQGECSTVQH